MSDRIRRAVATAAPIVFAALSPAPAASQDVADIEIEAIHVAGPIHMLSSGSFGNVAASIGPDGVLLVDDKIAPLAPKLRAAIDSLGGGPLGFVLNTHWHGDHAHGNIAFGDEAPILAHANVRKRLSEPQETFGRVFEPLPDDALPVVTFGDSVSVWFNGEEIRAFHLPGGHTDGDVVVWFLGSNVVHTGDLFMNGQFPVVDLDTGGDVEWYTGNVGALLARIPPEAKVVPGHGPLGTVADLQEFHVMLRETIGFVRRRIAEGVSLEAIREAGLPPEWEPWGEGFVSEERWIDTIHRSLTRATAD